MTELDYLERIAFCCHVAAFGVAWIAGCLSLKFLIYFKNHKDLW